MQSVETRLYSRREAVARIAAATTTTVLVAEALVSLEKSPQPSPPAPISQSLTLSEILPPNPNVNLEKPLYYLASTEPNNRLILPSGYQTATSEPLERSRGLSRRGFLFPGRARAQAGFIMANKLAWSYYDWQSIYPDYAASKGMVLPHGPDGPLERHDNAHEEKYGYRSHAQEEMADWAASIERQYGFNPSYGFCHGLANAGILMPEPIRRDNPLNNLDYDTCVRLQTLKNSGMVHYQPHPYDHEANLNEHIKYFLATGAPFVVNTPLEATEEDEAIELLYRVVMGISPDGQTLLVTNFGMSPIVISRKAITAAYEPLTPEQAAALGVAQYFIDAAKGRTLTELKEELINEASYN